jgi:hypothetical protein
LAYRYGRPATLPLDLHVVADGILDQIIFDKARDKWYRAVGVSQIDSRARATNSIVPDDPTPSRRFRRDRHCLLRSTLPNESVMLNSNIVREVAQSIFGADPERPFDASIVKFSIDTKLEFKISTALQQAAPTITALESEAGPVTTIQADGEPCRPLIVTPGYLPGQDCEP